MPYLKRVAPRAVLFLFVILCLSATAADDVGAQVRQEDVVYLKDGSIIRGTIVETVPGVSILIETRDGNRFRYTMDQIARLTKEGVGGQRASVNSKSPALAWGLSFLMPGLGQFYNGQTGKGVLQLALHIGLVGAVSAGVGDSDEVALILGVALVGNWLWSMVDAPLTAKAINEGRVQVSLRPSPTPVFVNTDLITRSQRRFDVGVRLNLPGF